MTFDSRIVVMARDVLALRAPGQNRLRFHQPTYDARKDGTYRTDCGLVVYDADLTEQMLRIRRDTAQLLGNPCGNCEFPA